MVLLAALATASVGCGGKAVGSAARDGGAEGGVGSSTGLQLTQAPVSKVDLLFMIANTKFMDDKQALLALAVPNLVQRLTQPWCVSSTGVPTGTSSDVNGICPAGSHAEFPPVHDMHIGIVSSSLGSRGGDVCPDSTLNPANMALNAHDDDHGELINRAGVAGNPTIENTIGDAPSPLNFLSYVPAVAANAGLPPPPTPAVLTPTALITDFTSLIEGVHNHGCGFVAPNEAWYRFLVQPDPFATVNVNNNVASVSGIDETILQQRADFLRPNSLVAVVVVADKEEEIDDPLTIRGQGWAFDKGQFPGSQSNGGAPEGTVACQQIDPHNPSTTGPNSPECVSCAFLSTSDPSFAQECPKNGMNGNDGYLDPANDSPNLRYFHQKERFGLVSEYPTSRYVRGLQKTRVPSVGLAFHGDADHEHDSNGNYVGDQDSQANCVNPLFATNLPKSASADLCHLTQGPRTPDLVYYAAFVGVPHELLQATPGGTGPGEADVNGNPLCPAGTPPEQCPQKTTPSTADWKLIKGNDPEGYDLRGADFHMIESIEPRTTNNGLWANAASCTPPAQGTPPAPGRPGADPANGCEFNTNNSLLQFACIFPLIQIDANNAIQASVKDCTNAMYGGACGCASNSLEKLSPLCSPTTPTNQLYAPAWPGVREMVIAQAMAQETIGGQPSNQGIVSSLCPIALDIGRPLATAQADPLFGYNPAVNALVGGVAQSFGPRCLITQSLTGDPAAGAPCTVLVTLPPGTGGGTCTNPGNACDAQQGLYGPGTSALSQNTLDAFCDAKEQQYISGGGQSGGHGDPASTPVCALQQLTQKSNPGDFSGGSCASAPAAGWCYVTGAAAGKCAQTAEFVNGSPPTGTTANLVCPGL